MLVCVCEWMLGLGDFFSSAEQKIDSVAEKAQSGGLIEHDRPALGRFEHVAGELDADEAGQGPNRVHDAEHRAGVLGRQILRVDHDAGVVEAAARHRARHHEQRRLVGVYLRDQDEKEARAH